ncbi:beta-galactosidase [Diaminobutyricimonas aerilata]|uniref:Beta-galactosidase n=1 Tax=Diaminobutyricimonas aerilata TaxID=1162967 RepID=A0A2M9CM27_9MICO|nr:beta-galactosidase [Diaminobutyricimonas aerilata]PJJ72939.1 beta-galactosidase [Diaminobutyricimonas aerilata]
MARRAVTRPSTRRELPAWPTDGLSFGGDYNPEQWSPEVWREDVRLMREAGVNIVTLGVFSWGLLEPREGEFEWGWFDEIIGLLHENGIAIDLATPTAAPPSWLLHAHPDLPPLDAHGERETPGGRLGWCPSSPVFREHALRIVRAIAERYGDHPAVKLWHVSNELGGGNGRCHCEVSTARFQEWLREQYGTIEAVNAAWGSAFWGHTFTAFEQITTPTGDARKTNPGRFLDFERFSSDELLEHYLAEAAVLRELSDRPVTTNLMVGAGGHVVDYSDWAQHVDVVANDHYTIVDDPLRQQDLSFAGDRMRGLAVDRKPWLLMEHSTGAPSWQERNRAKAPGEIVRNALAHVARGSDGAMFFQWRASTAGTEQFHSAMLPHAGTASRVWREIVQLGDALQKLKPIAGSPVEPAKVALLVDEESAWSLQQGLKPHRALRYARETRLWHRAFWQRQVLVDVLPVDSDLEGYDLVILPTLFVVSDAQAARIDAFVRAGGTALVTYLSGVVDETNRVRGGGYPGAFRDLIGVTTEEFRPLQTYETVRLSDGGVVTDWSEDTNLHGAEPIVTYADGDSAGRVAVSRNTVGDGAAWYVSAMLPFESAERLADRLIDELALPRAVEASPAVEAVRRVTPEGGVLFLINHSDADETVAVSGESLLDDAVFDGEALVPAGAVVVVREAAL